MTKIDKLKKLMFETVIFKAAYLKMLEKNNGNENSEEVIEAKKNYLDSKNKLLVDKVLFYVDINHLIDSCYNTLNSQRPYSWQVEKIIINSYDSNLGFSINPVIPEERFENKYLITFKNSLKQEINLCYYKSKVKNKFDCLTSPFTNHTIFNVLDDFEHDDRQNNLFFKLVHLNGYTDNSIYNNIFCDCVWEFVENNWKQLLINKFIPETHNRITQLNADNAPKEAIDKEMQHLAYLKEELKEINQSSKLKTIAYKEF